MQSPTSSDPKPGDWAWFVQQWQRSPWRVVRGVAVAVYVVLAIVQYVHGMPWASKGIPLEREQLIGWFLVGSIIWSLGRDRVEIVYAIAGWGALAACFVLYDYTRGAIDGWWGHPNPIPGGGGAVPAQAVQNASRIITAEKALFFGHLPTEFLQEHFYVSAKSGPLWEVVTALTYLSHFLVVYLVAMWQWVRDKARWVQWVRALTSLIVLGVIGYFLFPTAPPWLADRFSLIGTVHRPGTRALKHIHLEIADRIWNKGKGSINIVAAMPSLHFGFTALVAFFFWRTAKPWFRAVLVAYPCVMLFTLSYGGEHYVLDCVVGGALAFLAVWANRRLDAWWTARKATEGPPGLPPPPFDDPAELALGPGT